MGAVLAVKSAMDDDMPAVGTTAKNNRRDDAADAKHQTGRDKAV